MGFLDIGKKGEGSAENLPTRNFPDLNSPPAEKIMIMRSQGLTNNQIIQNLQREGYDSDRIFKAMNLADISAGIDSHPITDGDEGWPPNLEPIGNPMKFQTPANKEQNMYNSFNKGLDLPDNQNDMIQTGAPIPLQRQANMHSDFISTQTRAFQEAQMPPRMQPPEQFHPEQNFPPAEGILSKNQPQQMPPIQEMSMPMMPQDTMSIERIEEITEAIIDEKWDEIVKSINKIIDWKDRTENKIVQLDQRFADMKKDFENLSQGVLGKVGEYDKNLSDIGVEIRAMEKVFQKMLPNLTENVHALDKITKDLKASRKDIFNYDDEDKED
jgi:hypothetical protein